MDIALFLMKIKEYDNHAVYDRWHMVVMIYIHFVISCEI